MRDRFVRGLLAGLAGGVAAIAVNVFLNDVLNFGTLHFYEISGVMIFGHKPRGLAEALFAEIGHLGLSSAVGIALAYLIPKMKSTHLWIKGIFAGGAVWFAVYSMTVLFSVRQIHVSSLKSAISNVIASIVYGLITVWMLKNFDRRMQKAGAE